MPARVGIFRDALDRYVSADCAAAVELAAGALACEVVDATPPFQIAAEQLYDAVSAAETRAIIGALGPLGEASPQLQLDRPRGREERAPVPDDARSNGWRPSRPRRRPGSRTFPVLLAPAAAEPAFALGGLDGNVFDLFHHCKLASALGLPAAVVPVALSADGLPIGVQVIGRRGHEAEVLGVARAIEHAPATIAR